MADWRDGAEYAPVERPDGFATPRAEPLQAPPAHVDLASQAPLQRPEQFQPSQAPVTPLERLVPAAKEPPRDPRIAFDSGSQSSETSAWGAAHASFNPRAPMAVDQWSGAAPLGPGGSTSSFAPPRGAPVSTMAPPVGRPVAAGLPGGSPQPAGTTPPVPADETTAQRLRRLMLWVGWPYFVALLAGAIFKPAAILCLVAAVFFTLRSKIAKVKVQRLTGLAAGFSVFAGLAFNLNDDPISSLNSVARVVCVVVMVAAMVLASVTDADARAPKPPAPGLMGPPPGPRR